VLDVCRSYGTGTTTTSGIWCLGAQNGGQRVGAGYPAGTAVEPSGRSYQRGLSWAVSQAIAGFFCDETLILGIEITVGYSDLDIWVRGRSGEGVSYVRACARTRDRWD